MGKTSGLVDVDYHELHRETDDAYGFKLDEDRFGEEAEVVWFPKRLTELNDDKTFSVPQWLAEEKGVV